MFPYSDCEFWCPEMSSNDVSTRLTVVSLPLMCVCLLILCSIVDIPNNIKYRSVETMAAMRGL